MFLIHNYLHIDIQRKRKENNLEDREKREKGRKENQLNFNIMSRRYSRFLSHHLIHNEKLLIPKMAPVVAKFPWNCIVRLVSITIFENSSSREKIHVESYGGGSRDRSAMLEPVPPIQS